MGKINVNGGDAHPLWVYLKDKQGGFLMNAIKWNFTKFVVDKEGHPVSRLGPMDNPILLWRMRSRNSSKSRGTFVRSKYNFNKHNSGNELITRFVFYQCSKILVSDINFLRLYTSVKMM